MDSSKMKFVGQLQDDGEHADYIIASQDLHSNVTITYNYATKKWSGYEETSGGEYANFEDVHRMTEEEVDMCWSLIPLNVLPIDESPS